MYQSPVAAVTNDHKFSGLAQVAPCHRSVDQKPDLGFTRLKSKHHQGCVSFRSSEGEPTSLPFPASGDSLHPLALDIFLHLQSQPCPASHSSSLTTSSPNSSWERVFQFKKVKLAYSDIQLQITPSQLHHICKVPLARCSDIVTVPGEKDLDLRGHYSI